MYEPESNYFIAIANAMAHSGKDMETIARELALAFRIVVDEGLGQGQDLNEYARLRNG